MTALYGPLVKRYGLAFLGYALIESHSEMRTSSIICNHWTLMK